MSVQLVAPHSVATKEINSNSVRSCSAFSARESCKSAKQAAKLFINGSFRDRNHLLNPFLVFGQQLIHPNMRFPWSSGEGREGASRRRGLSDFRSEMFETASEALPLPALPR